MSDIEKTLEEGIAYFDNIINNPDAVMKLPEESTESRYIKELISKRWVECKTAFGFSKGEWCNICKKIPGDSGIDPCLSNILKALNDAGIKTVASCCGHGRQPGSIILKDGRELIIVRDFKTARMVEKKLEYPGITE